MRKSSQKIITEKLTHYLDEHSLKVVQLRKDEVKNTSYEEGSAVIVSNTVSLGHQLNIEELVAFNHSDLAKNDLFFDFLKHSNLEKLIKQDDFIEFLKNTLSNSVIKNSKKNQHYHIKLYDAISEENYLIFLARPSYIVETIAALPSSLFSNNEKLFNKVFDIALKTKAFKNIDFQMSTYKFVKENSQNSQKYNQYFTQLNFNSSEAEIKTIQLQSIKIELNTIPFAIFNVNKTYSFNQACTLIEYCLESMQKNIKELRLETFNYYKNTPLIIIHLSAEKIDNTFYESFILNKVKDVLSENEIGKAIEKTKITQEEIEKTWFDFTINNNVGIKKNKIKI